MQLYHNSNQWFYVTFVALLSSHNPELGSVFESFIFILCPCTCLHLEIDNIHFDVLWSALKLLNGAFSH
jgi:hypothetical protein